MRYIKILDIAPTLFEIDVLQYQSRAAFSDQDGQFEIAQKLLQLSLFSSIYEREALNLLHALTLNGHAPAQTLEADLIMRYNPKQKAKAMKYYRTAAIQGFAPAAEKMQTFKMASEVSEKYPKAK